MISLDKFKVKLAEEDGNRALFEIGPLPRGFGYTLGNSIRRILLSSVSGSAVTAVKIDGVKHEYSTMEGVHDDIITILLKVKEIAVKIHDDGPHTIKLSVKGKKGSPLVVTAADFDLPSEVEVVNGDLEITTLTKDVDLTIELTVEKGTGYAYPDENKRKELGVMPIDSVFSPVKRVQLDVVQARLGQYTDLDQINLNVFTNGTMSPAEALLEAVEIFDHMANKLVDLLGGDSTLNQLPSEEEEVVEEEEEKILVSQLNLSTRLTNALLNAGISDLRDLRQRAREEVASFRGMGKKSMTELEELMLEKGLTFSSDN
ncbi:DNA-directed RNA polymerase subunit alpha [Candidatus Dojkabacteria bacterium]|uniref:DNA-directed RNA polymerase subunit alpha n=1 Tax=Candidatus Dojkabacteria bacterium TaxID=2099670 RepID=A0A955L6L3_9BACT|nr:DNA-directed RNA polymerase subunit alpha [Candidatus Dojkabacteria bacterium]